MDLTKNLVIKHNDLNAINYFKSSVQLKIFSRLIIEIIKEPKKKIYNLPTKQILKEVGAHSKNLLF